ncbi:hypothetical protein [Chitinilyticum piscinae]|uniref:Uncharacterized protein n=1 Tax=Chitinilyticum piscinae TaxID=2866724 RepID=A0A8J7FHC0_9NEIS|nr:hypothetical protein [Chitinilyticum piscinae]MBE9608205.1 hypothetical protein [Chitinilyticum piscinae]
MKAYEVAPEEILAVVENQIAASNPPIVRQTLNRLLLGMLERDDAIELIAVVLVNEMDAMLEEDRGFDLARYTELLKALPELPEEQ